MTTPGNGKIPTSKSELAARMTKKASKAVTKKSSETLQNLGRQSRAQPAGASELGDSQQPGHDAEQPTGVEKAKAGAKRTLGNVASGAAQGAMQGAVGGAAGAAAGAAKGAAFSLAKDKNVQKIVVGLVMALVVIIAVNVMMTVSMITSVAGAIGSMDDQNANYVVEEEAAEEDGEDSPGQKPDKGRDDDGTIPQASAETAPVGVTSGEIAEAQKIAGQHNLPWTVVLAAREANEDINVGALAGALKQEDPRFEHRDLTAGYTYSSSQLAMVPPDGLFDPAGEDDGEGDEEDPKPEDDGSDSGGSDTGNDGDDAESDNDSGGGHEIILPTNEDAGGDDPSETVDVALRDAETVEETFVAALASDDVGLDGTQAQAVFERARAWGTASTEGGVNTCAAAPPGGGDEVKIDGGDWSGAQVANMKTLIGIAKTMFGKDARDAAIIGLITARVESSFQNYANDGQIGPEDNNMGGATAADYAKLAYSLELPHDAVGTDHSSLGMMQQQAVWGWGDYQDSTWDNDPEAVIERLMDSSFVAAKFYVRLDGIDWKSMSPGDAAQTVQGSAFPDRYAEEVGLAKAIWKKYGDQSALDVPKESGWVGADGESSTGPGAMCNGGRVLDGDVTWPVEINDDGMFTGVISSDWGWRIHPSGRRDFHEGIDWTGEGAGSGIYAIAGGEVVRSETWPNPACGEYVELLHTDGTSTGYLHMNTRDVTVGDTVDAGAFLGELGGNQPGGCTFGAHLHLYAFDSSGCWMDPKVWLEQRGLEIPAEKFVAPFARGQTTMCS